MRIAINLATRPYADFGPILRRLRIAMGALAAVGILFAFGLHAIQHEADLARAQDRTLDTQISAARQQSQDSMAMMRQPENAKVLAQAGRLNQLFDEKAFSWTLAMEDLETVLPAGLQVTTLEPNRSPAGVITLKLRVAGPRDRAIELVQNLEHSRHFSAARIVGESAEATGGPNEHVQAVSASNRVSFDLLADYVPPADLHPAVSNKKQSARSAGGKLANAANASAPPGDRASQSVPLKAGEQRMPYLGAPRPKAPVQMHKGVAR